MPRGGRRPGSGRPKGSQNKSTLTKEAAREALREIVIAELRPLVEAQISNAKGIKFLVLRQKSSGRFLRRLGANERPHDPDTEIIEVWEKDPSVQAFADLMNRAIDKPIEPIEVDHGGAIELVWRDGEA